MDIHQTVADFLTAPAGNPVTLLANGELAFATLPGIATGHDVDLALQIVAGGAPELHLGARPAMDGLPGIENDAGVDWFHYGLTFFARGRKARSDEARDHWRKEAFRLLNWTMRRTMLMQTHDGPHGVFVVRTETTSPPSFYEQDKSERVIFGLSLEQWIRPIAPRDEVIAEYGGNFVPIYGGNWVAVRQAVEFQPTS